MLRILDRIYLGAASAGSGGGSVDESRIIVKSATIPTAGENYLGSVYMYVGETNSTYTHGYIYECVESGSTYAWERIDVQPGATRGRFLALWNCATGLAETNPPSSPYPYGAGDYYIVGTVGTTNYKPSGSSYVIGTASTTVETNDVAVNDTYYYDGNSWNLQKNTATEYVAGTGISINNKTISVASPTLTNTSTGSGSLTISGTSASDASATNVGVISSASGSFGSSFGWGSSASGNYSTAVGAQSTAYFYSAAFGYGSTASSQNTTAIGPSSTASAYDAIALGHNAKATKESAIQIGNGVNSEDNTMYVGALINNTDRNYKLLDLTTGKIPADRLPAIAPSIDNTTITENSSDELQASAVMNARTGTDVMPIWQGTEQEWTNGKGTDWYNWRTPKAISSKNFTLVNGIEDDTNFTLTCPASNSSTYAYLSPTITETVNSFSIVVKIKTSSNWAVTGTGCSILNWARTNTGLDYPGLMLYCYDGIARLTMYQNGTTYHSTLNLTSLSSDTWYWFKYEQTGTSSYSMSYSEDGETFINIGSGTGVLEKPASPKCTLYQYTTGGASAKRDFVYDLSECSLTVNDTQYGFYTFTQNEVYTAEATPTTTSTVYSSPNTTSALTITSVGTGTITLSDNNTYTYTSSGDVTTYQTIGDAYPNYLANINGVGVKIGNTLIADNTDTSALQTKSNLVTSVSSSSTDTQYPSAKLLYDTVGNIEATLDAIIAQGSNS